jgi:nucleoid DNA-binding protein
MTTSRKTLNPNNQNRRDKGRNPQTGAEIQIVGKKVSTHVPGKVLKDEVK